MTVTVHVYEGTDATIVALDGVADGTMLAEIGDTLATMAGDAMRRVVVDLDRLTLLRPAALHQLVDHLLEVPDRDVALAASRSSMRRVLRRWGIATRVPVHRLLPPPKEGRR